MKSSTEIGSDRRSRVKVISISEPDKTPFIVFKSPSLNRYLIVKSNGISYIVPAGNDTIYHPSSSYRSDFTLHLISPEPSIVTAPIT